MGVVSPPSVYLAPQVVRDLYSFGDMFPAYRRGEAENGLLLGYRQGSQYVVVSISTVPTGGIPAAHRNLLASAANRITTPVEVLGYWAFDELIDAEPPYQAAPLAVRIGTGGEITAVLDDEPVGWVTDDGVLTSRHERLQTVRFEKFDAPRTYRRTQDFEYSAGFVLGVYTPSSIVLCVAVPFDRRLPFDHLQRSLIPLLYPPHLVGIYTFCREPVGWAMGSPTFSFPSDPLILEWPDNAPPSARTVSGQRLHIDLGYQDDKAFPLL